jgi:hypothetical protein
MAGHTPGPMKLFQPVAGSWAIYREEGRLRRFLRDDAGQVRTWPTREDAALAKRGAERG